MTPRQNMTCACILAAVFFIPVPTPAGAPWRTAVFVD